ncbi:uncharacterized protein LOC142768408 [Rhipicephalus microplus]|uniref:uncharacterized protein LOC142768408 n=1 Tax=Rhipicephalus microplus TaxID=6941 RepID=UPI003F6D7FBD
MTYYSKSGGKLTSQAQRPMMVPGSDQTQSRTVRAVSVAALNLTPMPGGGFTTTPVSGANTRALAGTQIANMLQQCGLLNQPGGGSVPITFVSLEPVPDGNATSPITNASGPSSAAREFVPRTSSMGYNMAGFKGTVPQPLGGAMPSTSRRYSSAAPWTIAGGASQYGSYASSTRGAYGYPPYRDNNTASSQYRHGALPPTSYGRAFANSVRISGAYNRFPGTPHDVAAPSATGYSPYGPFDGKTFTRPAAGNPPYAAPYDNVPGHVDIDVERCPPNNGSPTQYNVSVRGMPRRSTATRRSSCGAPTSRSRRGMSLSPPPRDRSASPVPRNEIEPMQGPGPGPTSRRSVGTCRSRGRAREQELAREALDEAQDILATVREQMDTRDDFKQRMGARDLERFKAAVKQLERALDAQKSEPLRCCKSPPVE